MLFAKEYDDYHSHLFVLSGLISSFITDMTYLEWETGRYPGDEECILKGF